MLRDRTKFLTKYAENGTESEDSNCSVRLKKFQGINIGKTHLEITRDYANDFWGKRNIKYVFPWEISKYTILKSNERFLCLRISRTTKSLFPNRNGGI